MSQDGHAVDLENQAATELEVIVLWKEWLQEANEF